MTAYTGTDRVEEPYMYILLTVTDSQSYLQAALSLHHYKNIPTISHYHRLTAFETQD